MSDLPGLDRGLEPADDASPAAKPRNYGRRALMLGAAATGAGVAASLAGGGLAGAATAQGADPAGQADPASPAEPAAPDAKSAAVLLSKSNSAHGTTQVITRSGSGLKGQTFAKGQSGVVGFDTSTVTGGHGVYGNSSHGDGVLGISQHGNGVVGQGSTPGKSGVVGIDTAPGGGGNAVFAQSHHGTAVLATSGSGVALHVEGVAKFSHSGVVSIPGGHQSATVHTSGVSEGSIVLATIQRPESGVSIEGATAGSGSFTITLSKKPTNAITVGWLVLG